MNTFNIRSGYMQSRFRSVCRIMGWNCEGKAWDDCIVDGHHVANVGFTFIQRGPNPQKAYYRIVRISNAGGGEHTLSDSYQVRELAAWMDGIIFAHEVLATLQRSTQ